MIEISEIYRAPQGEGPNLGRPSLFVRTRRCTLHCSWCDSKFTWKHDDPDFEMYEVYSPLQLAEAMCKQNFYPNTPHAVVLTGGEPLIWQRELPEAIRLYRQVNLVPVEVETSGTIVPNDELLRLCSFNISHKFAASNPDVCREFRLSEETVRRVVSAGLPHFDNVCFKPVVQPDDEYELSEYLRWLYQIAGALGITWQRLRQRIYLMPEATTAARLIEAQRFVIELAGRLGVCCTTRMHILAYGSERRR